MVTYEHIADWLYNIDWIRTRRKEAKMANGYSNAIDMSVTIVSGATAGVMSWILVIPFDVMKTIMQIEFDAQSDRYRNLRKCLKTKTSVSCARFIFQFR